MGGQTCGATQKQKRAEKRKKRETGNFVTNFHKNIKKEAKKHTKLLELYERYIYASLFLFNQTVTEEVNSKPKFCFPGNTTQLQGIHFNFNVLYSRKYSSILFDIPGNTAQLKGIQFNLV